MRFLLIAIALFSVSAQADEWTRKDTYREVAFIGLLYADYNISLDIKNHPDMWETNVVLGEHPTDFELARYDIICAVAHPVISYVLPAEVRHVFQYVTITIEIGAIGNNMHRGLRYSRPF